MLYFPKIELISNNEGEIILSRALIQTANQSPQNVALNGIIALGSVQRRFGCACRLSGNAIEVSESGYYLADITVTVTPTEIGNVTIALFEDGVAVQGATNTGSVAAVGDTTTIPIVATLRKGCCDVNASNLTVVLTEGPGVVNNISTRVQKA